MRIEPLLPFLVLAATTIGCGRTQPQERAATMPAAPFDSVFRLVDTLTPEQPDSAPIGLVSGIDFAPDGSFVLADVRGGR